MTKLHLKSTLLAAAIITYAATPINAEIPPNTTQQQANQSQPTTKQHAPQPFLPQFSTGFEQTESHPDNPNQITWMTFDNTSPLQTPTPWSMSVFYESPGNFDDRHAQITQDPEPSKDNPNNSVLHFWLQNATVDAGYLTHTKGRIQTGFPGQLNNATEIYSKQRMLIHEDLNILHSYPATSDQWWKALPFHDFWTGAAWEGHPNPSNIGFSIFPHQGQFYLHIINRAMPELDTIWEHANLTTPIPVGEWFDIEIAYKMGDANTGRIVVAITESTNTRTVLLNITDITYDPDADLPGATGPVPATHWNPQKIYASDNTIHYIRDNGGTAQFYFDDFQFSAQWPTNFP